MKCCLSACFMVQLLASGAVAATLQQDLQFSYSRLPTGTTILENGPGSDFPYPYYKVVAPTGGQLSALQDSTLQVTYEPLLATPGTATIDIQTVPISASFRETFGTSATVGLGKNPFDSSKSLVSATVGMSVDARGSGYGYVGSSITGTDVGVAQPEPGLGIPFVLEGTASPSITATDRMSFGLLSATAFFTNRDTGVTFGEPLLFTANSYTQHLAVDFNEPGIYDVSLTAPFLGANFTSTRTFGVSFNVDVFGSGIISPPPTITLSQPTTDFSNVPFQLASNDRAALENWFSIVVAPEPSSWALSCLALPMAWVLARRTRRKPGG